jgi:GNAT superfamily N-acetyltransferase
MSAGLEISEEPIGALAEYASVPFAFEVRRMLDVSPRDDGRGGFALVERANGTPWVKDYDAIPEEGPATWPKRFDVSRWGFFAARLSGRRVGGAAVAIRTPGLDMLEGRDDLAVLWDIRVAPDARGEGVGSELLRAAEAWAMAQG